MMRRMLLAVALIVSAASSGAAQSLPILTRATAPQVDDSTLFLVSIASPFRTRAVTLGVLKAEMGVSYPLLATNGSAAAPSYSFANSTGLGFYRRGADTLGLSIAGIDTSLFVSYNDVSNVNIGGVHFKTKASRGFNYHSGSTSIMQVNQTGTNYQIAGNSSSPVVKSGNTINTGYYFIDASTSDTLAFTANGTRTLAITNGAPQLSIGSDGNTGLWSNANDDTLRVVTGSSQTLKVAGGPNTALIGGAGNMTILAGTGASRTLTLQTMTSGSAVKNTLVLGADSSATFLGKAVGYVGSASHPSFGWSGGSGFYQTSTASSDTIQLSLGGVLRGRLSHLSGSLRISGVVDVNPSVALVAAGNDNGIDLYPTDASSNAVNGLLVTYRYVRSGPNGTETLPTWSWANSTNSGLYLGSNGSTDTVGFVSNGNVYARGFQDTLILVSKAKAPSLTAASGTPNSVCIDAATKQLLENAATNCTVSALRYKNGVNLISPEWATPRLMALQPSEWTYNDGGRRALGLIADNVDSVDSRLGFRDRDGRINSYDQAGVIALLVATVQQQQRQIDSLIAAGKKKP